MTWLLIAEAEKKQTLLERLDGATRAKVLAALAALALLGLLMMVLTWLGGRFTRKFINQRVDIREPSPTADGRPRERPSETDSDA